MLWETIRLSVQAILRNFLRSFLTVLGVVIGVAAVIAMVTVGQGSTDQVTQDVAKLGTNLLMVRPGQPQQGPGSSGGTAAAFDMRDVGSDPDPDRGRPRRSARQYPHDDRNVWAARTM